MTPTKAKQPLSGPRFKHGGSPEAEELRQAVKAMLDANRQLRKYLARHTDRCRCPVCRYLATRNDSPNNLMPMLHAIGVVNANLLFDVESLRDFGLSTPAEAEDYNAAWLDRLT